MRFASSRVANQIWYTTVLGVTIYVCLFLIAYIWIDHASNREEFPSHILDPMYIGLSFYQILSIVNVAWLFFLVADLFSALRLLAHPQKGKLRSIVLRVSSILLSIAAVVIVQWAASSLKRVADAYAIE